MREYSTGSRWALWRWTAIPTNHLLRLHLFKTPWVSVYLHWLLAPDPQPDMHDHPCAFISLILRGWYWEKTPEGLHRINRINFIGPNSIHRIVDVRPGTVTLCFAWHPKGSRLWGFHTSKGWIPWTEY